MQDLTTSLSNLSSRRRPRGPCHLLDDIPFEIREKIWAYALSDDVIHIIPLPQRLGHTSLLDEYPVICSVQGPPVSGTTYRYGVQPPESGPAEFDHNKAVLAPHDFLCTEAIVHTIWFGHSIKFHRHSVSSESFTDNIHLLNHGIVRATSGDTEDGPLHLCRIRMPPDGGFYPSYVPYSFHHENGVEDGVDIIKLGNKFGLLGACRQIYRESVKFLYKCNTSVFSNATNLECFAWSVRPEDSASITHLVLALNFDVKELKQIPLIMHYRSTLVPMATLRAISRRLTGLKRLDFIVTVDNMDTEYIRTSAWAKHLMSLKKLAPEVRLSLVFPVRARAFLQDSVQAWSRDLLATMAKEVAIDESYHGH